MQKRYHEYMRKEIIEMKASDYIIRRLREIGMERIFVIYGAHNADLIDSLATDVKSVTISTQCK